MQSSLPAQYNIVLDFYTVMPLTTMLSIKPLRFRMPDSWLIISCNRYPGERGVWSIRGQSSTEIGGKVYSERDERERKDVTKNLVQV